MHIEGRTIAATFWGKAWCENLENYHDYENRLPRGRTYVRNGSLIDLQIAPREVKAMVSGSSIYNVSISIGVVPAAHWQSICTDCSGGIDSLVELLQGRLSKGVMERLCRQANGLFPKPSEIRFSCSCPDHATMCKHVAATLYGVGARLDKAPELLFRLRAVDETDLVANVGKALPVSRQAPGANVLDPDDLSSIFGLDMAGADSPIAAVGVIQAAKSPPAKPSGASRKPSGKGAPSARSKAPAPAAKSPAGKQGAGRKGSKAGQATPRCVNRRSPLARSRPSARPLPRCRKPSPGRRRGGRRQEGCGGRCRRHQASQRDDPSREGDSQDGPGGTQHDGPEGGRAGAEQGTRHSHRHCEVAGAGEMVAARLRREGVQALR